MRSQSRKNTGSQKTHRWRPGSLRSNKTYKRKKSTHDKGGTSKEPIGEVKANGRKGRIKKANGNDEKSKSSSEERGPSRRNRTRMKTR
jgi:hypothetical protein